VMRQPRPCHPRRQYKSAMAAFSRALGRHVHIEKAVFFCLARVGTMNGRLSNIDRDGCCSMLVVLDDRDGQQSLEM
jgi:hypothetical protein